MSTATHDASRTSVTGQLGVGQAWDAGAEAAHDDDVSLSNQIRDQLTLSVGRLDPMVAANLAAGAVMLLMTLMIVLLAALVGGQFADAIPSDSPFDDAITTTEENAGTAFVIFGVSLLAIPTVSVLAYIVVKLGPFIGFGTYGGGGDLLSRR